MIFKIKDKCEVDCWITWKGHAMRKYRPEHINDLSSVFGNLRESGKLLVETLLLPFLSKLNCRIEHFELSFFQNESQNGIVTSWWDVDIFHWFYIRIKYVPSISISNESFFIERKTTEFRSNVSRARELIQNNDWNDPKNVKNKKKIRSNFHLNSEVGSQHLNQITRSKRIPHRISSS